MTGTAERQVGQQPEISPEELEEWFVSCIGDKPSKLEDYHLETISPDVFSTTGPVVSSAVRLWNNAREGNNPIIVGELYGDGPDKIVKYYDVYTKKEEPKGHLFRQIINRLFGRR